MNPVEEILTKLSRQSRVVFAPLTGAQTSALEGLCRFLLKEDPAQAAQKEETITAGLAVLQEAVRLAQTAESGTPPETGGFLECDRGAGELLGHSTILLKSGQWVLRLLLDSRQQIYLAGVVGLPLQEDALETVLQMQAEQKGSLLEWYSAEAAGSLALPQPPAARGWTQEPQFDEKRLSDDFSPLDWLKQLSAVVIPPASAVPAASKPASRQSQAEITVTFPQISAAPPEPAPPAQAQTTPPQQKFCKRCGAELKSGARFCTRCGTKLA